jgi:hypothetical protein
VVLFALLVSDSGSFSSNHSSFRRSQKPSSGLTPLSEHYNGSLDPEEVENQDESDVMMGDVLEGNDDITEEAQTEEPTTGVDAVSLDEDVAGIDDDEDEIEETIHSFEDSHNTENEKRDRDSLRIDDTDGIPCRVGTGMAFILRNVHSLEVFMCDYTFLFRYGLVQ